MTDIDDPIDRMREDFRTVVADRKRCGYWADGDEVEAGSLVKAAIDAKDADMGLVECWANWLAKEAEQIRRERSMRGGGDAVPGVESAQARNRREAAEAVKRGGQ